MDTQQRTPEFATWIGGVDTAWAGVAELHCVFFEHRTDRGGFASTVMVQIPEVSLAALAAAFREANQHKARVGFICDTRDQADAIAKVAAQQLAKHRRVSLERAKAGGWGLLQ